MKKQLVIAALVFSTIGALFACFAALSDARPVYPTTAELEQKAVDEVNAAKQEKLSRQLRAAALFASGFQPDSTHWVVTAGDAEGYIAFNTHSVTPGPGGMTLVELKHQWYAQQFIDDDDHAQGVYDEVDQLFMINCGSWSKAVLGSVTYLDGVQVGTSHVDISDLSNVKFVPIVRNSPVDRAAAYACSNS